MLGLLGKKLGQTRVCDAQGHMVPVTVVLAGPNRVLQCRTKEVDGYSAVQLGFGNQKSQRLTKAMLGHVAKQSPLSHSTSAPPTEDGKKPHGEAQSNTDDNAAGAPAENVDKTRTAKPGEEGHGSEKDSADSRQLLSGVVRIREFRDFPLQVKPGDLLGPGSPGMFAPGDFVDAIGVTKGRGFEGVVKRHGFRGGDLTHGAKGWHRRPGAIGQRLFPGTVMRGTKLPGHMGQVRRTVQNLEVIQVMAEDNLLLIKGALPGANGDYVIIRESKKLNKAVAEARRKRIAKAAAKSESKGGAKVAK